LTGDIEKYGSGFIRIREEIRNYPTMAFRYEESGDGFLVSLSYQEQKISSIVAFDEGVNEGVNELLTLIRNEPGKRIPRLAKALGVPAKTVERWIVVLKKKSLIEYRGSSKTGGYYTFR